MYSVNESDAMALIGMMGIIFFLSIASYVLISIAYYKLAEKANLNNKWMAFIPVFNMVLFLKIIKWNPWHVLWCFVPAVSMIFTLISSGISLATLNGSEPSPAVFATMGIGILITVLSCIGILVLSIVWAVKLLEAFGMSGLWVLLIFLPYLNTLAVYVLLLYMAFSKNVQYKLNAEPKIDASILTE